MSREKLPYQYRQRGSAGTVSVYLALALLALSIGEAVVINHLFHHRVIQIQFRASANQPTQLQLPDTVVTPDSGAYITHAFPAGRETCDADDTICYIRI